MARTALVLGAFVAVGPLTIDMYLPALPTIANELQTTEAAVQLTLTGTLVGLALGQLLIGPLSDALGRRGPLLAGTALHVLASLLIMVAPTIETLGVLRVLQGVGTAAGAVVALAVVRDLYDGRAAATMLSRLFLVMGAAPVLAPTIGGEVLRVTSWRGVFGLLALYGVALLVMGAFALRETLPRQARRPLRLAATLQTYRGLLRDRTYVGLVLVAGLTMAGLFSYVAGSSFVYQGQFGLDEQQFGLLFGAGAFWLIAATQLNPLALRRFSPAQVLLSATVGGTVASAVLLGFAATGTGGLPGVVVPLWAVLFATGLALPNAPALALSRHGEAAGAAAAVLGAVQFGIGAVVSPLVGVLGNDAGAMGAVILVSMVMASVVLLVVVRPWLLPDPEGAKARSAAGETRRRGAPVRLVCLGDSFTEGMNDDPRPDGHPLGWADRVAHALAQAQAQQQVPGGAPEEGPDANQVLYANLAVRGRLLDQVVAEQVPVAVAMAPTLTTFHAGPNDVLRRGTDLDALVARYEQAVAGLVRTGTRLVLFTSIGRAGGDGRLGRLLAGRFARFNDGVRAVGHRHGAAVVDLEPVDVLSDRRMWHVDRLHLNADGHARVAAAVLEQLDVPDPDRPGAEVGWWRGPLPPAPPRRRAEVLVADAVWARTYLLPWLGRRLRGRSSGDGRTPKDPVLRPVATA